MPGISAVLERARVGLPRISAAELPARQAASAWVIDLRPWEVRRFTGHIPGAVVIDRLVLEWRLDPTGSHRMLPGPALDDEVYLVCNEGFASSLAARDLQALGFTRAGDVIDGVAGWCRAGLPTTQEPTRLVR